jgi:tripartite ATP-independent transporter DctP family solute receptor
VKKYIAAIVCLVMVLGMLAGCGGSSGTTAPATTTTTTTTTTEAASTTTEAAAPGATYTIKLGHACSSAHPYNQGAQKFKELVEERTDGAITVELYPDSLLGAERDLIEGLQMGSVEMCIVSTAPLSSYSDAFLAFDLPFLFTTKAQARGVVDSEIGQSMFDSLAASSGIIGLCYFENGFRHFTNDDHPLVKAEDFKGMKIRVMENQVMMATITALGGSPTPMAFNELYTALQQKTIDGEENPIGQIYDKKMYEVQHYITISNHFYAPAPLLISASFFESLPADYQEIVKQAALEARDFERERTDAEEDAQLQEMIDKYNVEVCYDPDIASLQAATQAVYDDFVGDGKLIDPALVDQIRNFA